MIQMNCNPNCHSEKSEGTHELRDSQRLRKTIMQSFNKLKQQNQVNKLQQLQDVQTQNRLNNIRQTDTYDLL